MDIKILENKINNERGNQSSGWNTAIRNAAGDIIIRVDAHAEIPADFIEQNVRLIERGEYVCGGARPNKIESPTPFKEMLFLAESSMFGSSVAGYRRKTQTERYVSSVFHGAYRREVFEKVGGFNRDLGRTEDNELHYRIREAGYKILQSESIISYQYIRGTLSSMMKQKYGRIVSISSIVGLQGNACQVNYSASKAGVIGITKSAAREYAGKNITCNAIAPGFVQTPMTDVLPEKVKEQMLAGIPLKRYGQVEDIANAVGFLVSDDASYITGQVLSVDGGMHM